MYLFVETDPLLDEVAWPGLYFHENFPQIEPVHPKEKHLQPQTKVNECRQGEPTWFKFGMPREMQYTGHNEVSEHSENDQRAKVKRQLQAERGERKDSIGGKAEGLTESVAAVSGKSWRTVKKKLHLLEADVGHLPAKELEVLGHAIEGIHALTVQKPEVRATRHQANLRHSVEDSIEPFGKSLFHQIGRTRVPADGVNYVRTILPKPEHFRKQRRRVLKVAIQCNDDITVCSVKPTAQGILVAHIARKRKAFDGAIVGR